MLSVKVTCIAARRTLSYVYQNFDNTEVSKKEVTVGPRVGKEELQKGKLERRRIGKRNRGTGGCGSVIDCSGTCTISGDGVMYLG